VSTAQGAGFHVSCDGHNLALNPASTDTYIKPCVTLNQDVRGWEGWRIETSGKIEKMENVMFVSMHERELLQPKVMDSCATVFGLGATETGVVRCGRNTKWKFEKDGEQWYISSGHKFLTYLAATQKIEMSTTKSTKWSVTVNNIDHSLCFNTGGIYLGCEERIVLKKESDKCTNFRLEFAGSNLYYIVTQPTEYSTAHLTPPHKNWWCDHQSGENFRRITPDQNSDEFHFFKTMLAKDGFKLLRLTRIQNQFLFQEYKFRKTQIEYANGQPPKELFLYHGTKQSKEVVNTQQGLDPSFSKEGTYGTGVYLAMSLQYTDKLGFAPTVFDQQHPNAKQVLIFKALIGNCAYFGHKTDHTLKRPPQGQLANPYHFDNKLFDSVCGREKYIGWVFSQSEILGQQFVIYDSSQVYPSYVVDYEPEYWLS